MEDAIYLKKGDLEKQPFQDGFMIRVLENVKNLYGVVWGVKLETTSQQKRNVRKGV